MKIPKVFIPENKNFKKNIEHLINSEFEKPAKFIDFERISTEKLAKQLAELKLSDEDKKLVEGYKTGIKVYIFHYTGSLQINLRESIKNFGTLYCKRHGVEYEMFDVSQRYFSDIRKSVFLTDKYGRRMIEGIHEVQDYLSLLENPFYQKHNIITEMKKKLKSNNKTY